MTGYRCETRIQLESCSSTSPTADASAPAASLRGLGSPPGGRRIGPARRLSPGAVLRRYVRAGFASSAMDATDDWVGMVKDILRSMSMIGPRLSDQFSHGTAQKQVHGLAELVERR